MLTVKTPDEVLGLIKEKFYPIAESESVALADAIGSGFFMYPIQMHRAKRLTKNKSMIGPIAFEKSETPHDISDL